jgi:hypothetical protein
LKSLTGYRVAKIILFLLAPAVASSQVDSVNPDLLRLERLTSEAHVCVLLKKSGAFHLETDRHDSTQVAEGTLNPNELRQIETKLEDSKLRSLSQKQIEEPLIQEREQLQVNIFRDHHRQDLSFYSRQSQQPYRDSLEPLIRWLNNLHKLPHREISEEEGKNNCLPQTKIALKKRTPAQLEPGDKVSPALTSARPAAAPKQPEPVPALLRVFSYRMTSAAAYQRCILITANGDYRTEEREQKLGSPQVDTQIIGGKITQEEISQLQRLLASPALEEIRHRASTHLVLPMSGEMLNLKIYRTSGVQDVVLSSTFNRGDVPFFYGGDGDISSARPLMEFLAEHVQKAKSEASESQLANDCQQAP